MVAVTPMLIVGTFLTRSKDVSCSLGWWLVSQAVQLVTVCQVNGQHSGGKSEKRTEQEGWWGRVAGVEPGKEVLTTHEQFTWPPGCLIAAYSHWQRLLWPIYTQPIVTYSHTKPCIGPWATAISQRSILCPGKLSGGTWVRETESRMYQEALTACEASIQPPLSC